MELGAFSISLAVKDIAASRAFYEMLGFSPIVEPDPGADWMILTNGDHVIGLFQGMFERNMLTFNPGWDQRAQETESFTDVRDLAETLRAGGLDLLQEAGLDGRGPGSFVVVDPDGNPVLIDQHRPAPD